ncbi:Uncharacterised protein [Yersinia similis]|nr:Uncharacterised protein [Yersinia similis]CNB21574.1 Uncharacterised protein [Yersinia similis]CNE89561.1 Uncharacterised protein [Yersinia similis]
MYVQNSPRWSLKPRALWRGTAWPNITPLGGVSRSNYGPFV